MKLRKHICSVSCLCAWSVQLGSGVLSERLRRQRENLFRSIHVHHISRYSFIVVVLGLHVKPSIHLMSCRVFFLWCRHPVRRTQLLAVRCQIRVGNHFLTYFHFSFLFGLHLCSRSQSVHERKCKSAIVNSVFGPPFIAISYQAYDRR